jgi:hypothetical protein
LALGNKVTKFNKLDVNQSLNGTFLFLVKILLSDQLETRKSLNNVPSSKWYQAVTFFFVRAMSMLFDPVTIC